MRAIRYILAGLALALAAVISAVFLLAATPAGFAWLANRADNVVPGELQITAPAGSLLTTMQAADISFTQAPVTVHASQVRVRLNWIALLAGEIRLSKLDVEHLSVTSAATADETDQDDSLPTVDLPISLRVVRGNINQLSLDVPGYREDFSTVRLRAALRGSRLKIAELSATLAEVPISIAGELRMANDWPYSGTVRGELELEGLPAAQGRTRFAGDRYRLQLDEFAATTLDGSITGQAQIEFSSLTTSAMLQLDGIELAGWQSGLPEVRSGRVALTGRLPDDLQITITDTQLQRDALGGELDGKVDWDGTTLRTDGINLEADGNQLNYIGDLFPSPDGSFTLDAPAPAVFLPGAAGRITASGRAALGDQIAFTAKAVAEDFSWQGVATDLLQIDVRGTDNAFDWQASGTADAGNAKLNGNATLKDNRLELAVAEARIEPTDLPAWQLTQALRASVDFAGDAPSVAVATHCWASNPLTVCVDEAAYSPQAVSLRAHLAPLDITDLPAVAGLGYRIEGTAQARLLLEGRPDNPSGRLIWEQQATRVAWTDPDGNTLESLFPVLQGELRLNEQRLRLTVTAESDAGASLSASADTAPWSGLTTPVAGRLVAALPDISLFAPLLERYAALDDASGALTAELLLSGTLAVPTVNGSAELNDSRASIRALGIDLTDITLGVTADENSGIDFEGSARSGDGQLDIEGTATWGSAAQVAMTLKGDNVTVLRFPQQVITASPDLAVSFEGDTVRVTGDLLVPYADVTIEEVPATAASPSRDARVVRREAPERRTDDLAVVSDIRLRLGEEVRFSAFGLQTRLGGQLRLSTTAENQQPFLDGNVRSLEGSFNAFKRELDIERGVLIFNGDPENPNVDVRAIRRLRYEGQDVKVIVGLSGPLQSMQTRLSGEPAMSESDALSYLVLNRPARRTDSGETEQLSAAAMALGMVNLLPATETLRNSLGIDEIEFEGSTRESSAISAGKRLSDDFYIRYSYGLFERVGRFIVRYDIGRGLSLEAGSGQEQTIDLLYSIDR